MCIENLPRTCLGNTPEELLEIIKDIPGVKVCFDTNHYTKGTTGHFVETVGERIGTIHASDFDFVNECHWLPTQGDIQWGKLMHALEGIGYEGVFMYEATKDHENDNTRPTPERVVETFNKIINDYKIRNKMDIIRKIQYLLFCLLAIGFVACDDDDNNSTETGHEGILTQLAEEVDATAQQLWSSSPLIVNTGRTTTLTKIQGYADKCKDDYFVSYLNGFDQASTSMESVIRLSIFIGVHLIV